MAELGDEIDRWFTIRAERQALANEVERLGKLESEQETKVLALLNTGKIVTARGTYATASRQKQILPSVKNWDALHEYIYARRALDLFERRISRGAWVDRVEHEGQIPGIDSLTRYRVRLHTLPGMKGKR